VRQIIHLGRAGKGNSQVGEPSFQGALVLPHEKGTSF
jgi:hypothetical protein